MRDGRSVTSSDAAAGALRRVVVPLLVVLLFGDYLILSASRAATGSVGNWTMCVAGLQLAALAVLVVLGDLRRELMTAPVLACLAFGGLFAAHHVWWLVDGAPMHDYATQKTFAWFGLCLPALFLGLALGRRRELPGGAWFWVAFAPLLAMCAVAVAIDPDWLTIAHFDRMAVLFGALVLPAHQPLAYCLTKGSLYCFARIGSHSVRDMRWWMHTAVVCLALGLVLMSGARTYLLGALLALGVLMLFSRRRAGVAVLAGAGAVFAVQSLATSGLHDRIDPTQALESASFQERTEGFALAVDAFLAAPLLGQGPGGFAIHGGWYARAYPHNLVLEMLAETGVVGALAMLVVCVVLVRALRRLWRARANLDPVQAFAIGLLVFSAVAVMAVGDLIRNHFLFLAVGLTLASARRAVATVTLPANAPRRSSSSGLSPLPSTASASASVRRNPRRSVGPLVGGRT